MRDPRYELFEELGKGSSAVVYRARDNVLGRDVALKLLHTDREDDALVRLRREAKVAATFHHPNAVEIYEVGELDGRPFLAMELVRGMSLDRLLAKTSVAGVAAAVAVGRALAEVLAAAHAVGLVHRDIKPSNIFIDGSLDEPMRVRLVDFGLAFMLAPSSNTMGRLTEDGFVVGTPSYMAPEQADGREIGPPADVYALGCLLYELVSGRTPFLGTIPNVLTGHMYLPPIPLAELELAEEISTRLDTEILTMLAKDPIGRPTAAQVLEQLSQVEQPRRGHKVRSERWLPAASAEEPEPETLRVFVAPNVADADKTTLIGEGIELVELERAELVITRMPGMDDGSQAWPVPVVGLHRAPTPLLMAGAIRAGIALVLREPLAPGVLPRLAALARTQRLTRG